MARLRRAIGHEDWDAAGQLDAQIRLLLGGLQRVQLQAVLEAYAELMADAGQRRTELARQISRVRRRHSGAMRYAAIAGQRAG